MGFLRNIWDRYQADQDNVYSDSDTNWTSAKVERMHFYFLIEFLLQESGYAVGDLFRSVEKYHECHTICIPFALLGFMYFTLFEFIFKGRTYTGAGGRELLGKRMDAINFFVDVAQKEHRYIKTRKPNVTVEGKRRELMSFST